MTENPSPTATLSSSAATAAPPARARSIRIDALRGIAVFGILLINVWSFVWGFQNLRYGMLPDAASLADRCAVFLAAFAGDQKFYPVFAFLFGAGFALQTRSLRRILPDWRSVRRRYRRRLLWLLGWGVLHGTLVWFGDILTIYGLVGFLILPLAGAPPRRILGNLQNWCVVWSVLVAVDVTLALAPRSAAETASLMTMLTREALSSQAIYTHGSVSDIALQRLGDYASVTSASLYLVPHLMVLFLLGMLAVRLGWLVAPKRHRVLWKRTLIAGFCIGIPFNLAWAAVALAQTSDPHDVPAHADLMYALLPVGGTILSAGYVAWVMLAGPAAMRWLRSWIAPVGRMSLTNYLLQSVFGTALLQSAGLGLGAGASPAMLLLVAAAIMLAEVFISRWWLARHAQGPIESLYVR